MGILRRDGNQNQLRRRDDQNAIVRGEPQSQLVRDVVPSWIMRDPLQLMREMMIDPYRVMQQLMPSSDVRDARELMWNPSFEVRETDDAYLFKGDLPGVRDEDLDVTVTGNNLQITGKREREREHNTDEGTVHAYERAYGQFVRTFSLPEAADIDKIRCDLDHGVLTIVVPKRPGASPQRRKIQIGGGGRT